MEIDAMSVRAPGSDIDGSEVCREFWKHSMVKNSDTHSLPTTHCLHETHWGEQPQIPSQWGLSVTVTEGSPLTMLFLQL